MTVKICTKCGAEYDTGYCKLCSRARIKLWRENLKNGVIGDDRLDTENAPKHSGSWAIKTYRSMKVPLRQRFMLTPKDLVTVAERSAGSCFLSGKALAFDTKAENKDRWATLIMVDPTRGWKMSNVRVVTRHMFDFYEHYTSPKAAIAACRAIIKSLDRIEIDDTEEDIPEEAEPQKEVRTDPDASLLPREITVVEKPEEEDLFATPFTLEP